MITKTMRKPLRLKNPSRKTIVVEFSNGTYVGEFNDNKLPVPHGLGKKTYKSGDVYYGQWHEGKESGLGGVTSPGGKRKARFGLWKEGEFQFGVKYTNAM